VINEMSSNIKMVEQQVINRDDLSVANIPPTPETNPTSVALPGPLTLTFRRAVIETESIDDLDDGIICGQVSCVDHAYYEDAVLSTHKLSLLFAETINSGEGEAFTVGFIIGVVDALLRARKTYPREW
jgi:hypothetical protein